MKKRFLGAALLMILVVGMVASTVQSISTEDTEQCLPTTQAKEKAQYKVFLRHLAEVLKKKGRNK